MYCVIQEIPLKKRQKPGYPKELVSTWSEVMFCGKDQSYYYHRTSFDCFERPIQKAYRISIHESFRETGRVKKRQYPICTVNYYDLATGYFTLYDWGDRKIAAAADALHITVNAVYDLLEKKVSPLQERIQAEFRLTEESQAHEEQNRILESYKAKKTAFCKKYRLDSDSREYDRCYDVFGNLGHPENLEQIKAEYQARQDYEKRSEEYQRSYYENYQDTYNSGSGFGSSTGNPAEADKELLKKFYRALSKQYHPDSNPGKDTTAEMKLLNQLKQEWGV